LPNPCHDQDYDRSMLSPAQSGSEGCSPKMCADEVNDEDEGQVCQVHYVDLSFRGEPSICDSVGREAHAV